MGVAKERTGAFRRIFLYVPIHNWGKLLVIHMKARDPDTVSAAIAPIRQLQDNDRLSRLFAAHYGRVLTAAYRVTGNMADAEDVAQSVFLRLGRGEIPQASNFGGYLYRSAVNAALDLVRQRKPAESLDAAGDKQAVGLGASPEKAASDRELGNMLRQAISELTQRSAEMFALRYLEDMDNRQIAELMDTSQAVVAVTLYQARAKLRKKLARLKRGML
jgi:RNA polymerase sigma factor (sigma-70 family)